MSDVQEHTEEHSSPIKTPKQLITTVVLAFIVPITIIILLVKLVAAGSQSDPAALAPEAVAKRIAPRAGFALVDADAPRVLKTGEQVYTAVCASCHSTGVAGAPKMGDAGAWAPFIKAGYESMLNVALHGKGAMPAKGGNPTLDDVEVARALVYMANQSGGSLPEPAEPSEGGAQEAPAAEQPASTPAPAPAAAQPAEQPAAEAPAQSTPAAEPATPVAEPATPAAQ